MTGDLSISGAESSIEVDRVADLFVAQVLLPGSWPHYTPAPQKKILKEQGASGYTIVKFRTLARGISVGSTTMKSGFK
jgi:hypothetical protein